MQSLGCPDHCNRQLGGLGAGGGEGRGGAHDRLHWQHTLVRSRPCRSLKSLIEDRSLKMG